MGSDGVGVDRDSGAIHLFPMGGAVPLIVLVIDVPSTRCVAVPGAEPDGLAAAGAPATTTPACGLGFGFACAPPPGAEEPVGWAVAPVVAEVVGTVAGGLVVADVVGVGAAVVGVGAAVVGVGATVVGVGATVVTVGAAVVGVAVGVEVVVSDGRVSDGLGFFLTWLVGGVSGAAETWEGAAPRISNRTKERTRVRNAV